MYRTCRHRRFADGTRGLFGAVDAASLSFSPAKDLARATRYLQNGAVRAEEGTRLLSAHCLHLWGAA